jgi:hypothetical protein
MRVPFSAIGIVLLACASVQVGIPYDVSAPTVIPGGVLGRIDSDGATTIYMEGLDLKIAVQNQRSYERGSRWDFGLVLFPFPMIVPTVVQEARPTENEELSPLVVSLTFDSREEGTLFNPDSVTVDLDDGTVQSMEAFRGPADGACGGAWVGSESSREFELPRGQTTCFVLQFPVQISPDVHFGLHFSGLTRLREPTPPVELRFIKFKGHSAD